MLSGAGDDARALLASSNGFLYKAGTAEDLVRKLGIGEPGVPGGLSCAARKPLNVY